jgi:hypothetical protein
VGVWDHLVERFVSPPTPASAESLRGFEKKARFALHPSIQAAWTLADGFVLSGRFCVLSVAEASRYIGAFDGMQMFAFTGDDSDPFCVACHPALDGRVVRLMHDFGEWELAFRSLDDFAAAVMAALKRGRVDQDSLQFQYTPQGPRSADDQAAGVRLLGDARLLCEQGADQGPWFTGIACALLSDADDLAPVLDWSNEYAREHAEHRLRDLDTKAATDALGRYDAERAAFDERCIQVLEAHGFPVLHRVAGHSIRIGPAQVGLNMPAFFNRRKDADAMDFLLERAAALTDLAKKRAKEKG